MGKDRLPTGSEPAGMDASVPAEYVAFISYRHTESDKAWAQWLHTALEKYRIPKGIRRDQELPSRLGRIFRDHEELSASASLSGVIDAALVQSRFLVVVCSPRTPESEWVNAEVRRFRQLRRQNCILTLLIEGEPQESFPPALFETSALPDRASAQRKEELEPHAVDVRAQPRESRRHLKRMAVLRIASAILDCRFDDLRRRDHEQQRRRHYIQAAVGVMALTAVLFMIDYGLEQQQTATDLRGEIFSQEEEARQQRVFGASLAMATDDPTYAALLLRELPARQMTVDPQLLLPIVLPPTDRAVQVMAATHEGGLRLAEFSPDGEQILTVSDQGSAQVWTARATTAPIHLEEGADAVSFAEWSPDGSRIVTTQSSQLCIWSSAGDLLQVFLGGYELRHASWSPDGKRLLADSEEGLRVIAIGGSWDSVPVAGYPVFVVRTRSTELYSVRGLFHASWARDGNDIAIATDEELGIWKSDGSGTPILLDRYELYRDPETPMLAMFSPDGERLFSLRNRIAKIWIELRKDFSSEVSTGVNHAAWNHEDGRLAMALDDGVRVMNSNVDDMWTAIPTQSPVRWVEWSPDGTRVLAACEDGRALIASGERNARVSEFIGHDAPLRMARWSPDGKCILTASEDGSFRVWRMGGSHIPSQQREFNALRIAWNPDGKRFASVSDEGLLEVGTVDKKHEPAALGSLDRPPNGLRIAWNPAGDRIFVSAAGQGQVWDMTGKFQVLAEEVDPENVDWSPDGKHFATREWDLVRVWNADSGSVVKTINPYSGPYKARVDQVQWSPDSTRLAVAYEFEVAVIPIGESAKGALFPEHDLGENIQSVSWCSDNALVASSSSDGTIRIWDSTGDAEPFVLYDAGGPMTLKAPIVKWSPNGNQIAIFTANDLVQVWAVNTRVAPMTAELRASFPHDSTVISLDWDSSARWLATRTESGGVRILGMNETSDTVILRHGFENVSSLRWSADGERLLTDHSGRLCAWAMAWPEIRHALWRIEGWLSSEERVSFLAEDAARAEVIAREDESYFRSLVTQRAPGAVPTPPSRK